MAWRCSGRSNAELVQNLRANGIVRSQAVFDAMSATDRALYTRSRTPYEDAPQVIQGTQATLSAPHMHAHCLEQLKDYLTPSTSTTTHHRGDGRERRREEASDTQTDTKVRDRCRGRVRVLDVGCGSGYLMACMSRMTNGTGVVVGIDHIPTLTSLAVANLESDTFRVSPELSSKQSETEAKKKELEKDDDDDGRVVVVLGDGREGCAHLGPYDAIHVGAACSSTVPSALIRQLKRPGRLVVPVAHSRDTRAGPGSGTRTRAGDGDGHGDNTRDDDGGWDDGDVEEGEQWLWSITKDRHGTVTKEKMFGVRYVPLCDAP